MAGPSIMVRVLGDLTGLGKAAENAGKTAQGVASKMHTAFGGVIDGLNRAGVLGPFGDVLGGINNALGEVVGHAKDIGPAMIGIGGAIAGVGAGLALMGSKDQAAHQQLQASIEATGASYEDFGKQIEAAIKHQEKFGDTAAQTQNALQTLTQATHDPAKALDLLSTATDLAAAKHMDLNDAAGQLGKVYNGNTKLLKQFGIEIDKSTGKTKDGKTATEALAGVLSGQASAAANTFTGHLDAIKAKVEDQVATFGQKYGPAITAAGAAMTVLGGVVTTTTAIIDAFKASQLASTVATYAQATALAVTEAVGAPLIVIVLAIVAAVAALIAIGYVLYRNWGTIWAGIKAAAEAVWNWIKNNWPLLLGILLGPIALAVVLIQRYWTQITAGVAAAVGTIVRLFTGLPGQLAGIFSGMWDGMLHAFRSVLNGIIDLWNSLHFTLPHIDLGPLGKIGGGDIGVPHIPHLAAGGVITADGLIYAHAGEAITPAGKAAGPAVVVQQANFATGVDIDLFMRRAAWAVQLSRL